MRLQCVPRDEDIRLVRSDRLAAVETKRDKRSDTGKGARYVYTSLHQVPSVVKTDLTPSRASNFSCCSHSPRGWSKKGGFRRSVTSRHGVFALLTDQEVQAQAQTEASTQTLFRPASPSPNVSIFARMFQQRPLALAGGTYPQLGAFAFAGGLKGRVWASTNGGGELDGAGDVEVHRNCPVFQGLRERASFLRIIGVRQDRLHSTALGPSRTHLWTHKPPVLPLHLR